MFFLVYQELEIHYLYIAMILFIICNLTIIIISLLTSVPGDDKIINYTWSKNIFNSETKNLRKYPIYKNYRFQSVILILTVAIILFFYW